MLATLRLVVIAGLVVLALPIEYMPGGTVASAQSTTLDRPAASQSATRQPVDPGAVDSNVKMAEETVRLFREGLQTGQIQANDVRMSLLALLVQQKISLTIKERIADPADRDAALARTNKIGDMLDTAIMPAFKKAAESKRTDDVRAVLSLLDQLDKQLVDLEKIVPPGPEDERMHQTLIRASEQSSRSRCAAHMAEVLKAIAIYTTTHKGRFPATLGDLYQYVDSCPNASPALAAEAFLCPNDKKKVNIPAQVTPEWVNQNTSYVYLGNADLTDHADPGAIILHENLDAGHGESINVGFADFHVQSIPRDRAQNLIAESKQLLAASGASLSP